MEQQHTPLPAASRRFTRRVRSRSESPSVASENSTTGTPRLDLAFILNDARDEAVPFPWPVALPQRRATPTPPTARSPPPAWLGMSEAEASEERTRRPRRTNERKAKQTAWGDDHDDQEEKAEAQPARHTNVSTSSTTTELSREEKRRGRTCRVDGCDNYIVHKGLCCRHGGARRCSTEGCESTAKYMGLCWKHGGSTWCKVEGCTKRAKAKGRCWAHGGGTQCSHESCTKVAVSNGLCWAHGGGKRCLFDGCNRPGYERTNGFCDRHFDELQGVDYFEV